MLNIQKYLRAGNTLEQLEAEYAIKAKRHGEFPELVCLKYSQLESPFAEELVQECRGIILNQEQNWEVVSYPYKKFFNYGEQLAAPIAWDFAEFQPKLDGSLMTLYFYKGAWRVQSSGTADAGGQVGDFGFTFADLFWRVFNEQGYDLLGLHMDLCYMFELETPYNRIVVKQETNQLTLHGVRNRITLEEQNAEDVAYVFGFESTPSIPVRNIDYLLNKAKDLDPMIQEGFIVVDRQFNRIKIKTEQYVRLAHFREGMTRNKLLAIAVNNEGSEVVSYFNEYAEVYNQLAACYDKLVVKVNRIWHSSQGIQNRKDFAMRVKDYPFSGCLFSLKDGKVTTVREYFKSVNIKSVMACIEKYYGEELGQS